MIIAATRLFLEIGGLSLESPYDKDHNGLGLFLGP